MEHLLNNGKVILSIKFLTRILHVHHAMAWLGAIAIMACVLAADASPQDLDQYNVSWDLPGADSRDSMPLGNGDIGMNVWVEKDGDLIFYISKTDAWSDNVLALHGKGLLKLGRVRVKLSPNPFTTGNSFKQVLGLRNGEIMITAGNIDSEVILRIWVDANHPVIRIEATGKSAFEAAVILESLRPVPDKESKVQQDTILNGQVNSIVWFYRNQNKQIRQLSDLTFGALIKGDDLISENSGILKSRQPEKNLHVTIHPLTLQTTTAQDWLTQLEKQIASVDSVPLETAREQHRAWWQKFWDRSWIFVEGDEHARNVTRGYVLQRYISACAGRGAYPIKFNGSIFTMDWLKQSNLNGVVKKWMMSADERDWGGQYWFQNTRAIYWPMLQSGDFEMMRPLFRMYLNQLPGNSQAVRDFYGHDGAYFAETNPFWGSLPNIKPDAKESHTLHYYTPILELSAMMLDYFTYTGDREFAQKILLPIADAGMKFFDQHWKRENGKLLLDPDNALEMFWKARNPAPDIAGLRWVLRGMLALPADLTNSEDRSRWQRFLAEIPELPTGTANDIKILLSAEVFGKACNSENPELYAIYPFRHFGIGKPDLELARITFAARRFKRNGCWYQDGIQAALLGETKTAKDNVISVMMSKDQQVRFPAFWSHGNDYVPDQDNGGNGVNALQLMLMQCEGRKIILLPAWPKDWTCKFKLHAPMQTVVEGKVIDGKVESLHVTPEERRKDVEILTNN